jgi:cobyrinic acid a,c-diamide synthase
VKYDANNIGFSSTDRGAAMGVVLAGTHSGVGKTTISLGVMAALRRRGKTVQPFKVGPDFIDPGHHNRVTDRISRNLDGWMLSRSTNEEIFRRGICGSDVAVVEGVMGLFDGYDGKSDAGSTAQMAKWLGLPIVLVVDARSMARSAGALVHGFTTFDPELSFAGVIFNRIGSPGHLHYLEQALEAVPNVRCLGGIPRDDDLHIPERHLGLFTDNEHTLSDAYVDHLASIVEHNVTLDALLSGLPSLPAEAREPKTNDGEKTRIAVAKDPAFCFYYQDNLDLLASFGAELVAFSPLTDPCLPDDIGGVYLGGGYPELFSGPLSSNVTLKEQLLRSAEEGMPIYAECGGLMYLCRELLDLDGKAHSMVGLFPMKVRMLKRLRALGYREITLRSDCILGSGGTAARGHEFHYSEIDSGADDVARVYRITPRAGMNPFNEGFFRWNALGSYVHLHFKSNPRVARNFVRCCKAFRKEAV